jgi:hypothetical protein
MRTCAATVTRHLLVAAAAAMALLPEILPAEAAMDQVPIGMPNCPTSCGNVSVPYPFGISSRCYLPAFSLTYETSHTPPRLLLGDGTLQVTDIFVNNSTLRTHGPEISVRGSIATGEIANGTWGGQGWGLADGGPYVLSAGHNEFIITGCRLFAELLVAGSDC